MHAVVFREEPFLVGQCIERDITVQSKTLKGIKKEFQGQIKAYQEIGELDLVRQPSLKVLRKAFHARDSKLIRI